MFSTAPVCGLVLTGGRSNRMGQDKALLAYHGQAQYAFVHGLLDTACSSAFVACRADQQALFAPLPCIVDQQENIGPMAALLAAFAHNPHVAWLAMGCDYPNMNTAGVARLLESRNAEAIATAYRNPEHNWPEPLLAIWEPKAFPLLQAALAAERFSLKRLLESNAVCLVEASNPSVLRSFDTRADKDDFGPK